MIVPSLPIRALATLLLGSLLVGFAHIALLPPFEGFDETGHFAYIQQVATTGHWPVRGDPMSRDIDDYLAVAPTAESMHGPWTYPSFFRADATVIERGQQAIHQPPAAPRGFTRGQIGNWQAQHPPLYYFALAPAYRISEGWGLGAQLFLLRAISYLLAWGGLCVALIAAVKSAVRNERIATVLPLGIALWPAIFPMWFPEMARLGNDSLIAIFAACTFILICRIAAEGTLREYALLGLTLGLALLTKATFLPVTAAAFLLLALLIWLARTVPDLLYRRIKGLIVCVAVTAAVSAWWYVTKFLETGTFIGSNDDAVLKSTGGLIAALSKNADVLSLVRSPFAMAESFLWGGTWSFVLPSRVTVLPIAVMVAIIGYGGYRYLRKHGPNLGDGFVLLTLVLFTIALLQHTLVLLALIGSPAPAWYLHSLAPILALLVGYGLADAMSRPWLRGALSVLLVYAPVFLVGATLLNVLFFAGCAPLLPGRRYFSRADATACLADLPRMRANLSVLAAPDLGVVLFLAGSLLLVIGAILAVRHRASITSTR